jgi:DHA1 family bicyclomycin/chloramphenicol resistance-like MFS transporter
VNRAFAPPAKPSPDSLAVGALLTALVALGQISTSIYLPSLPSLVGELATTPERVNLTLSLSLLGFAVGQLIYGPLSDRFGRRPVLLAGLALYLASTVACSFAGSIDALIVGRVLQGMTACCGPVLGRAIVRDVHGPDRSAKVLAYMGVAFAISPAVAPMIGGYLQIWFGWRAAFLFLAAVGTVLLIAASTFLAETNSRPNLRALDVKGMAISYLTLLSLRAYHGYTLAVAFVFAGLMAFTAGAPFVFIDVLGLSPERFGMLSLFTVTGFLAGSIAAGRGAVRFGVDRLLQVGVSLCLAGGGAMTALALLGYVGILPILVPMMVFTAGMGIVLPTGMAGAMAPFPTIAGAASALLGFVQMLVATAASVVVGLLEQTSQLPMAAVIAATAMAAFIAFQGLVRPRSPMDRERREGAPPRSGRSAE